MNKNKIEKKIEKKIESIVSLLISTARHSYTIHDKDPDLTKEFTKKLSTLINKYFISREDVGIAISKEMITAVIGGQPTSRLTSLFNRIHKDKKIL